MQVKRKCVTNICLCFIISLPPKGFDILLTLMRKCNFSKKITKELCIKEHNSLPDNSHLEVIQARLFESKTPYQEASEVVIVSRL